MSATKTRRETVLWSGAEWNHLFSIEEKARAVIAAGRPHEIKIGAPGQQISCKCSQCASWDALAALLEKEEA